MKPTWAPIIYHDGRYIYLEFENSALKFDKSAAGLSKALKLVPSIKLAPGYITGGTNLPKPRSAKKPRLTVGKKKIPIFQPSEEEERELDEIVKKAFKK